MAVRYICNYPDVCTLQYCNTYSRVNPLQEKIIQVLGDLSGPAFLQKEPIGA